MKWLPPRRGDIAAMLLGVLIVAILCLVILQGNPFARVNWGFGPEWDCRRLARDVVCIKEP
jgi:hypothetical protein